MAATAMRLLEEKLDPKSVALMWSVEDLYKVFPNFETATMFDDDDIICFICHFITPIAYLDGRHTYCCRCCDHVDIVRIKDLSAEIRKILVCCPGTEGCRKLYPIGEVMDHIKDRHREVTYKMSNYSGVNTIRRQFEAFEDELFRRQLQLDRQIRETKEKSEKLLRDTRETDWEADNLMKILKKSSESSSESSCTTTPKFSTSDLIQLYDEPRGLDRNILKSEPVTVDNLKQPRAKKEVTSSRHEYPIDFPFNPNYPTNSKRDSGTRMFEEPAAVHGTTNHRDKSDANFVTEYTDQLLKQNPDLLMKDEQEKFPKDIEQRHKNAEKNSARKLFEISDYASIRARERTYKFENFKFMWCNGFEFRIEIFADGFPDMAGKFMSVRVRLVDHGKGLKSCCRFILILRVGDTKIAAEEGTLNIQINQPNYLDFRKFVEQKTIEGAITSLKKKLVLEVTATM